MKFEKCLILIVWFLLILIFALPHILGFIFVENYTPCNIVANHDCVGYPSGIRDVFDGNLFPEDYLVRENKGVNVSPLPFFNILVYAPFFLLFLNFFGINIALIIAKLSFITINFYLLIILGKKAFKNTIYSVFFSTSIITQLVWKDLVLIIFYIFSLISPLLTEKVLSIIGRNLDNIVIHSPLIFDRLPRPNLTFAVLVTSIIVLINLIEKEKISIINLILYALPWSALIYSYTYNFISFFFALSLLTVFYFFTNRKISLRIIFTGLMSVIFSIPFWINYFKFKNSLFYNDYILRIGVEQGHYFRFLNDYFIWVGIILVFIIHKKQIKKSWFYFCIAFLAGGIFGLNMQILTGFNPQPDHFVKVVVYAVEFMLLTLFHLALNPVKQKSFTKKIIIIILAVLLFSTLWQVKYFHTKKELFSMPEEELEVYVWLENQFTEKQVILSDNLIINYHVALYTKHDVFLPEGSFTILTNEQLLNRTIITYLKTNYSVENFSKKLTNKFHTKKMSKTELVLNSKELLESGILNYIYPHRLKEHKGGLVLNGFLRKNQSHNEQDIANIVEIYRQKSKESSVVNNADYIVTEKELEQKNIIKVFSNRKYNIYQI